MPEYDNQLIRVTYDRYCGIVCIVESIMHAYQLKVDGAPCTYQRGNINTCITVYTKISYLIYMIKAIM